LNIFFFFFFFLVRQLNFALVGWRIRSSIRCQGSDLQLRLSQPRAFVARWLPFGFKALYLEVTNC
jgi:hypothetical protein